MTGGSVNAERMVLCWLATADRFNRPNVSPKEIHAEIGIDRFVIADIASARSVRNIRDNPQVCISLVDIFLQRGSKLEGTAKIIAPDHPNFGNLAAPLLEKTAGAFPIRHVISVNVQRTSVILAPSYVLLPDLSESELCADAHRTYGVQPISE